MKALISIDYTNDFVADNGTLTTGAPGQQIEAAICAVTRKFLKAGEYVVFAIDQHFKNENYHPEAKLFPEHNIDKTQGRELYGQLKEIYTEYQNTDHCYWMNKRRYSAFSGTDLDQRLRERNIHDIYLAGVCTDICILHTAIDAYNLGYQIHIVENAVASFDFEGHKWALNHFKTVLGAKIEKS